MNIAQNFLFLFLNQIRSFRVQPQTISPRFWNSANWLFKWRFRFVCFGSFSVCCHPKTLLPWQRGVTTSPLYLDRAFCFFLPATRGTATKVTQNDVTIIHVGITWLTHWRNLTSLWRYIEDVFEKPKFHQLLTISVMSWWRLLLLKNDLKPFAILNPPFWIN